MMNDHRAGDTVKITIYRGKKKMDVQVSAGRSQAASVRQAASSQPSSGHQ